MTKSQTEFFKMLDRKIDEVCVIPLPPFCVHVVVFFQVSWLQVLLLLLQVLCAIKVINKELSFPFLWQHKIVSLKGDWHGGGEKTKQIGTFYRKIFLLWVSEHWVPAWSVSVVFRSRFAHNFQFTNLTSVRVQKRFYDL